MEVAMIENVHVRQIPDSAEVIDRVVELWPRAWPPLVLDRPLGVGAKGGHAFVRYSCTDYVPGERVEFTFSPRFGLVGTHVLEVVPGGVRHTISARSRGWMLLGWPLAVRWLHDALFEDLFDNAARALGHPPVHRARWSPWVRLMRTATKRSVKQPA
jgi:hypothetical protein